MTNRHDWTLDAPKNSGDVFRIASQPPQRIRNCHHRITLREQSGRNSVPTGGSCESSMNQHNCRFEASVGFRGLGPALDFSLDASVLSAVIKREAPNTLRYLLFIDLLLVFLVVLKDLWDLFRFAPCRRPRRVRSRSRSCFRQMPETRLLGNFISCSDATERNVGELEIHEALHLIFRRPSSS